MKNIRWVISYLNLYVAWDFIVIFYLIYFFETFKKHDTRIFKCFLIYKWGNLKNNQMKFK